MQGISQEVIESEVLGKQESIQLASISSGDLFIIQHTEQAAGFDDIWYSAEIDYDNHIFVEGNVPVDIQGLLDDLEENFYNLPVVPCKVSFPKIAAASDSSDLPLMPRFLNESKSYNYIVVLLGGGMDFGDNPDQYHSLLANNGARHVIDPGFYLGKKVDAEMDGFPGEEATGDNRNGSDDEDGIVFVSPLARGRTALINVTASAPGILNAWMDSNGDDDWSDSEEWIIIDRRLSAGENRLSFEIPEDCIAGKAYMRFRFSSGKGLRSYGAAMDGEVEDYLVTIE